MSLHLLHLILCHSDAVMYLKILSIVYYENKIYLTPFFNPIALRKAKIVYNFGLSECNRVNSEHSTFNSQVTLTFDTIFEIPIFKTCK